MIAFRELLKTAGDDAIPKIIGGVKANKPADGPAMVKQIQDLTTVDLTKFLSN